jgi:hypothetical protein
VKTLPPNARIFDEVRLDLARAAVCSVEQDRRGAAGRRKGELPTAAARLAMADDMLVVVRRRRSPFGDDPLGELPANEMTPGGIAAQCDQKLKSDPSRQ